MMDCASTASGTAHVSDAARRPILTANQKVIGYKLLFRTSVKSFFKGEDSEDPNRALIDVSSLLGLSTLCNNRYGFISCTRDTLVEKYLNLLPPARVVAEIPQTVFPDSDVLESCRCLKASGYKIALSGFQIDDPRSPLAEFADFINVDIKSTSAEDAAKIVSRYRSRIIRMMAENVETREDFQFSKETGFKYFQGYFFRTPEKLRAHGVLSSAAACMRLLQKVSAREMDWQEIENILRSDVALYYRLLRYLNSAGFGIRGEVHTLRQALTFLGEEGLRRWCRLAAVFEISRNRPSDLIVSALTRARFAELVGENIARGDGDLFLLGLLSLMDSILEIPMGVMLDGLPLDSEFKTLLLEQKGRLSPVLRLLLAVEAGAWKPMIKACIELNLDEDFIAASYRSAMEWAQQIAENA